MSFADKAFKLAIAKETFEVLSPWWDLVSSVSLQMLTVVALMSLSIDVVTKFGTAVKCTPINNTVHYGGSQQVFYVNNACFEFGVGEYSQFFGLAILFQSLLLVTVDNFWLNWGRTKSTLKEFNKIVLEVHSSPCRQELIDIVLKNTKEKVSEEEDLDEVDGIPSLSQVAQMQAPVTKGQAQEAIKLNEKLQKFVDKAKKSTIIERAYKTKSALRLFVATVFIYGALREILAAIFQFEFVCDLSPYRASTLRAIPEARHLCVNLNAPFYRLLIRAFVAIVCVNWISAFVAVLAAHNLLSKTVLTKRPYSAVNDDYALAYVKRFRADDDFRFLMFLLSQTSNSMHSALMEFASPEFHEKLIEFMCDRDWGLEKLKKLLGSKKKTLKITDTDLLIVPPAVRKLKMLEEINISSNNYLSDLNNLQDQRELKSLKAKGCNIKDIGALLRLNHLRHIDVSENDIREIPKGIRALERLEYLNIKKNKMESLPLEILSMEKLIRLEVEESVLDRIDRDKNFFQREDPGVFKRIKTPKSKFYENVYASKTH